MDNQGKKVVLPATDSDPKPGDFPIGSAESRAAARALFEQRAKETPAEAWLRAREQGVPLPLGFDFDDIETNVDVRDSSAAADDPRHETSVVAPLDTRTESRDEQPADSEAARDARLVSFFTLPRRPLARRFFRRLPPHRGADGTA